MTGLLILTNVCTAVALWSLYRSLHKLAQGYVFLQGVVARNDIAVSKLDDGMLRLIKASQAGFEGVFDRLDALERKQ